MSEDEDPVLEKLKRERLQKLQEELKFKQLQELAAQDKNSPLIPPTDAPVPLGISNLTDSSFREFMATYSHRLPVFVDYWAPWCQPCRQVAPIIDSLVQNYQGKIIFTKLNTENNPLIPSVMGIQGIPTFQVWKDENLLHELIGRQTYSRFTNWLDLILQRIANGSFDNPDQHTLKRLKKGKLEDIIKKKEI